MKKVDIADQSPKKNVKRLGHRVDLYDRGNRLDVPASAQKPFYMGKVFVSSSKITWCKGKTRRENGMDIRWRDFIAVIEMLGITADKVTDEIEPFTPEEFKKKLKKRLRKHRARHKAAFPEFYPHDTSDTESEAEGVEESSDDT